MRVIDCEWGDTLHAANDDDLKPVIAAAYAEHGQELTAEQIARIIDERAYTATDS